MVSAPVKGAMPINCHLKSEVLIMLRCQQCSTHYTAVQIKNYSKSTSIVRVANTENFHHEKETIVWYQQINIFHHQQRWMEHKWVHEEYIVHAVVYQSWAEVTLNSEKIKPTASVVIKLRLSEQSVSQSVGQ